MKKNYFYYVVYFEDDGLKYAKPVRIEENRNLLSLINVWQTQAGAKIVHQCKTMNQAREISEMWNKNIDAA